jgi:hypoxanthine-DNA glycosylase
MRVHSFEPVADAASRVLVLGSMPGVESLRAGQYYAHPRNAFWRIMGRLLRFDPAAPYDERLRGLLAARVALWDVLESCWRPGSLDADIEDHSLVANPFADFFAGHPGIRAVCFNGAKAEACFRRHVLPTLPPRGALVYRRLPSTSPAHAGMRFEAKLAAWRAVARLAATPRRAPRGGR